MVDCYKVGIYLRLSREDERLGESGSITNQRAILMNYIKENELVFVSEYVDDGVSGISFDRIGFKQMIQDIEDKKINMVITKDTSRLGRDHIEFGYYVEKYFPDHNVRYVAVCDNIDTFYSNNDMLLFKSAYNDMYVKDISNKIRASLNIKKKNGEFVGAYAPYGYVKDKDDKHKLVIDEESANIVKRIFQLFLEKKSISKIASILTSENIPIPSVYKNMNRGIKSQLFGVWTTRTITDILKNPTYMGNLTQGRSKKVNYKSKKRIHTKINDWIIYQNGSPAIVSKEEFELVQNLFCKNKNQIGLKSYSKDNKSLKWKGFIYCLECGHTIGFRRSYNRLKNKQVIERIYGNCNYYLKKKEYNVCTPHSIRYEDLDDILSCEIKKIIKFIDINKILDMVRNNDRKNKNKILKEIIKVKKEIELEYQKQDRLYEDKLSGFIDIDRYLKMDFKIKNNIINLEKELASLSFDEFKDSKKFIIENTKEIFHRFLEDKVFLSVIIDKIFISEKGNIDIYFKIKNETLEGISCNTILK